MAGLSTVKTLPDSFLRCGLCRETINVPKALPCLHSYCSSCLHDYIAKKLPEASSSKFSDHTGVNVGEARYLPCPECPAKIPIQAGVEFAHTGNKSNEFCHEFPANSFLEKVKDTVVALTAPTKPCDICLRKGKSEHLAENWCLDCYEALCVACADVHQHTAVTSAHPTISIDEAREKPLLTLLKRNRDVGCSSHPGENVKLFCCSCCLALCAQCVALDHRKCDKVITVEDAYKTHEDEIDCIKGNLENLQRFMHEVKAEMLEEREGFKDRFDKLREEIKGWSKNLCERIKAEEEQLLQRLEQFRDAIEPNFESKIKNLENSETSLARTIEITEQLVHFGCDSEIMSSFTALRNQSAQTEAKINKDVAENRQRVKMNFIISAATEKFSNEFETLGELQLEEFNSRSDRERYGTWGVTCVNGNEIVVVDGKNKVVQKFRKGGNLVDQISVNDEPRDLTHIGAGDIVVTLNRRQIMFLSAIGKMKLKRCIKTQKSYHGIAAYGHDKLVVSFLGTRKSVDILSMDGEIETTIHTDQVGDLFFEPRYVATTKTQSLILISDFRKHNLVCVTQDGDVKFKYRADDKDGSGTYKPLGICTDRMGNIFVADYSKDQIVMLSGEGEFQRSVVTDSDEVQKPVAIDISDNGRLVVLQNDGMVKIFSY